MKSFDVLSRTAEAMAIKEKTAKSNTTLFCSLTIVTWDIF